VLIAGNFFSSTPSAPGASVTSPSLSLPPKIPPPLETPKRELLSDAAAAEQKRCRREEATLIEK